METQKKEKDEEVRIEINVNKDFFTWDREDITGLEILDLAHEKPDDFLVYIKRKGRDDDPVGVDRHVNLCDPENRHFRTVPRETTEG